MLLLLYINMLLLIIIGDKKAEIEKEKKEIEDKKKAAEDLLNRKYTYSKNGL